MKNDLISVIVPCYNVSKYVTRCLDSIINQTYSNLEIILVEDCSTDNTLEILKEYEKKDKRIKLVKNSTNGGLSYSRNIGVKMASGEYIGFIDSDDYIDSDFYEKLYISIKKNKSDISLADIMVVDENTGAEEIAKCYSNGKFNLLNVINNGLAASACNKLFKKSIITKYEFAEGMVNEDLAVVIPAIVNSKRIAYADSTKYYYIQHFGSIQNRAFTDKKFDIFTAVDMTLDRIRNCKYYEEIKDALVFNQLIILLLYIIPKEKNKKRRKNILKKYGALVSKYKIMKNKNFNVFLNACGKKHQIYYKLLVNSVCKKHYMTANCLISLYDVLYIALKKSVISSKIDIDELVKLGMKQKKMKNEKIKISVIIPNYNYARFIYQRVYSILKQEYKIHELIILDDKSKDNSIEVIDELVGRLKNYINIKTIYNEKNSGSAFKQWKKGFEYATGDYIWIAEADDYCEKNLLKELVKPIYKNNKIMISYCDTAFVDASGFITMKSIKPEIDIQKTGHWNRNYINSGKDEINKYSFLNNTIANVSSCLIKNGEYNNILNEAGKYKQAGDWLIYVDIMSKGYISYTNKALNYYRIHGNNVSSTMDHQKHLDEIKKLYSYYTKEYKLGRKHKKKMDDRIDFLKNAWGFKK